MGTLSKVSRDEVRKRLPGRDRGPVDKAEARSRKVAASVGTRTGRAWSATRGVGKAAAAATKAIADKPKREQAKRRRTRAGVAAGVGAVTGAAAYLSSAERRGGLWSKVKSLLPGGGPPSDEALADKVRSEVFRPDDAPKGSVNVNVQNGIVYLRGQLEDQKRIEDLVRRARGVEGVEQVESLLHTPA
jgi:hypothetical protein